MTRRLLLGLLGLALAAPAAAQNPAAQGVAAQTTAPRGFQTADLYRMKTVRDPRISPDGEWVAYTVSQPDSAKDKSDTDVWMAKWDGSRNVRLTSSPDGESSPRWSPDGRYLSFTSGRGPDNKEGSQIWLLDRAGGEAQKLTSLRGGVSSYAWAPDGKRIAVVSKETDPDTTERKTPKPIVIDRYHFKQDVEGYLDDRKEQLWLVDVATGKTEQVTTGPWDVEDPQWSPDGARIAFVSNRTPDPDRNLNADVWVVDAKPGATPVAITTSPGRDGEPRWSPDGKNIAYTAWRDPKYDFYNLERVMVIPSEGGTPREIAPALDRNVGSYAWTDDGKALWGLLEDDRAVSFVRMDVASGAVTRILAGRRVVSGFTVAPGGRIAILDGDATRPNEVFALEGSTPRPLSKQNDAWLAGIAVGAYRDITGKAPDGTAINAVMVTPVGYREGTRVPAFLYIHGGPASQSQHDFDATAQLFAARGYAVIKPNYRGSTGRGEAFTRAIYADWGGLEVGDVLATVDEAVRLGVADADRLVIGGWSYGGITTNYTIARDQRFKAAISGAGSSLQLTMYGVDQYIHQYETELGRPWENPEAWMKVSYPFFQADKITTPTLFMVGEKDFNVPAVGSEQMYQALKSQGKETQLVIYPGQYHGITVPSYLVDRWQRWLDWADKHTRRPAS
ncbi:MAG: S9 family peptidase [Gemmatimonadetes bacterium]|nr:S9 family peptidase [Gemmatimonadota bacterium]